MKAFARTHAETAAEELASTWTHFAGAVAAVVGLVVLAIDSAQTGQARMIVAAWVYGATLVFLYLMSGCFHHLRCPHKKQIFFVLDHVGIYLLIAGTYTPVFLVALYETWAVSLLGVVWAMAIAGAVMKVWFAGRWPIVSTALYLLLGWIGLVCAGPLWTHMPTAALWWILAGGLVYSVGVIFFLWDNLPFNHAIWHLFVIGGSVCHYVAVAGYLIP